MDIGFLITTYNRQGACQSVVDALQGQGDIFVLNDGCDYDISGARQVKRGFNFGKKDYWKTVNQLFGLRRRHKYYIMLPDDWMPVEGMAEKAVYLWENIADDNKICLNLLYPAIKGLTNWTGFPAKDIGHVYQTQWVDMCFICEERFFNVLGRLPRVRARASSGVGRYISEKLNNLGYNLYQVKEELFTQQEEHNISQMHNDKNSRISLNRATKRTFDTRGKQSASTG